MDPHPQLRKKRQSQIKKKDKGPQVYSKKSVRIQNSCTKSTLNKSAALNIHHHGSFHRFRH